ncbi:MAG TPA: PAS domain S-box protein, partial [Thermodesulfobacteriota bacterium]|nr:PAS domain S-box protein [Thermodesulfobacteriota bacterium]
RFADWSIQNKLLSIIALLVIVPLITLSYVVTDEFSSALKRSAEADLGHVVDTLHALFETNVVAEGNRYVIPPGQLTKIKFVIQDIVIGETGYAFVIDSKGNAIIHPTKEGENIAHWQDYEGNRFIEEMIDEAVAIGGDVTGEMRYPWINVELNETSPRVKITKFRYVPQLDWIIAAGSYEEEIFRAVYLGQKTVVFVTIVSLAVVLVLMVFLARLLTRPLLELTHVSSRMAEGEFSLRVNITQHDEIGQLAKSFNRMGAQIQEYTRNLEREVARRTKELLESKERYQEISTLLTNILESSTEYAIIATDLEGRILEFNTGARKLFGWNKDEIMGHNLALTYENQDQFLASWDEYKKLKAGDALEKEMLRRKKSGEVYLSRSVTTAVRDAQGTVIGYLEVSRDTTERKRLERELIETKDYLENILESSVDGIITTDKKGFITYLNRGMEDILKGRKEDFIGIHVSQVYLDGIAEARKIMSILRRDQKMSNYELTLVSSNGREIPIYTSAALLKNFQGEIIGTVGIFKDVSEKKRLEEELQKAQTSLLQAAKMRELGDLVSGVAHEINNPLMASETILYRIKQNMKANPEHANCPNGKLIDLIERCNTRIATIVNHLREFSRETETRFEPLDVTVPIANALLITEQQLLNHNIKLTRDLSIGLPKVMGSASQLEQVFLNIISNARDALDTQFSDKELIIRSFARTKDEEPGEVVISFTDSGPGISPENKYKIFDPFFSTKQVGSGTGLGLSICYGIVEKHGGRIEVDSVVGAGATFRVILPALPSNQQSDEEHAHGE